MKRTQVTKRALLFTAAALLPALAEAQEVTLRVVSAFPESFKIGRAHV